MEKFIRDNVHGNIYIKDDVIWELIDCPEFQRLRRISQLGSTEFVFPSAKHSRFSHCLGTYYIVTKFLNNKDIGIKISQKDQLTLKVAGLLHDIGHGPFSHLWEPFAFEEHEKISSKIINSPKTKINKVLLKYKLNPKEIGEIIEGTHKNKLLVSIISSQFDADRCDYLMRDALNVGVTYSQFDIDFILSNIKVINNELVFNKKLVPAIEEYLIGRYHMYKQIYKHKSALAFAQGLKFWLKRIIDLNKEGYNFSSTIMKNSLNDSMNERPTNIETFLFLDDGSMYEFFKLCTLEKDEILKDLSERLLNKRHPKASFDIDPKEFEKMKERFKSDEKYYFEIIKHKEDTLYNELEKPILFFDSKNNVLKLSEVSNIINTQSKDVILNLYIYTKDNSIK